MGLALLAEDGQEFQTFTARVHEQERRVRPRPELVFILPWNLREEIMEQLAFVREWGGGFILRTPDVRVVR